MTYFTFQKLNDNLYRMLDAQSKAITYLNHAEFIKITTPKYYHMKNGTYDDLTEDHLKKYAKLFETWRQELLVEKIDILQERELYLLVTRVFFNFCKFKIRDMPQITLTEYNWFNKLNLSSAMYFDETIKDIPTNSYSYDYKSFYPKTMSSKNFIIPNCEGVETKLDKLPEIKNLKCGIYNVVISSENPDFKKVFSFSKSHHYTDVTIKYAIKNQDKFDVKIELQTDGKFNCLLYDTTISGDKIFGEHFEALNKIKTKYPKNKLAKFLLSSLSGHLARTNYKNILGDDYENYDISSKVETDSEYLVIGHTISLSGYDYFKILNKKRPYHYNIRLYPWLISFTRNRTYLLAQESLEDCIRIQTDSVAFKKPMTFNQSFFGPNVLAPEEKSTGFIKWSNINTYAKECPTCNEWIRVSKMELHNLENH